MAFPYHTMVDEEEEVVYVICMICGSERCLDLIHIEGDCGVMSSQCGPIEHKQFCAFVPLAN